MKTYFHAFAMCQSMFCAIPAPQLWDEKARDKMLLFLPLVGLEIGVIWAALAWLCRWLELPATVAALLLFGADNLVIPAMILILAALLGGRRLLCT